MVSKKYLENLHRPFFTIKRERQIQQPLYPKGMRVTKLKKKPWE